jgi:hypothetical protein
MNQHEKYLGIEFSIADTGDGRCAWVLHPPAGANQPTNCSGTEAGGQNEAILAARKAIGVFLDRPTGFPRPRTQTHRPRGRTHP